MTPHIQQSFAEVRALRLHYPSNPTAAIHVGTRAASPWVERFCGALLQSRRRVHQIRKSERFPPFSTPTRLFWAASTPIYPHRLPSARWERFLTAMLIVARLSGQVRNVHILRRRRFLHPLTSPMFSKGAALHPISSNSAAGAGRLAPQQPEKVSRAFLQSRRFSHQPTRLNARVQLDADQGGTPLRRFGDC